MERSIPGVRREPSSAYDLIDSIDPSLELLRIKIPSERLSLAPET